MDPNRTLRTAFFGALNGNVTLNGEILPVYDAAVPKGKSHPCIILTGQTNVDPRLTKNCQLWEPTILVRCITKSNIQYDVIGQDGVDMIAEQVYDLITDLDMLPDFYWISAYVEADNVGEDPTLFQDSTEVFSRDIRFRNYVQVV